MASTLAHRRRSGSCWMKPLLTTTLRMSWACPASAASSTYSVKTVGSL